MRGRYASYWNAFLFRSYFYAVADPGFPRRGGPLRRRPKLLFCQIFCRKLCMKMKEIGPGAHVSSTPLPFTPNEGYCKSEFAVRIAYSPIFKQIFLSVLKS